MAARTIFLAATLALGLPGLVLAQARTTWQDPERRAAEAPGPRTQEAQVRPPRDATPPPEEAAPAPRGPVQRQAEERDPGRDRGQVRDQAPRPPARADRRTARVERPRAVRSARYRGGAGSTWRTGPDGHGFAGTYGGCSYRGFAGPNGYRLDRSC